MIELVVKISDDEATLTQKHLVHDEGLSLSHDDLTLKAFVAQAEKDFGKPCKDILIKIKYTW